MENDWHCPRDAQLQDDASRHVSRNGASPFFFFLQGSVWGCPGFVDKPIGVTP
jgi:hypothetical protein